MKKKFVFIILITIILLIFTSCIKSEGNVIQPKKLSRESKNIVEVLNDDFYVFDLKLDKSFTRYEVNYWYYAEDTWSKIDFVAGDTKYIKDTLGLIIDEKNVYFYKFDGLRHSKLDKPRELKKDAQIETTLFLNKKTNIAAGEDIELYSNCFFNTPSISNYTSFKDAQCDGGFAITITFFE